MLCKAHKQFLVGHVHVLSSNYYMVVNNPTFEARRWYVEFRWLLYTAACNPGPHIYRPAALRGNPPLRPGFNWAFYRTAMATYSALQPCPHRRARSAARARVRGRFLRGPKLRMHMLRQSSSRAISEPQYTPMPISPHVLSPTRPRRD